MDRRRLKSLTAITELRRVQEAAAEMRTARASNALQSLENDRRVAAGRHVQHSLAWSQSVEGAALDLDLTRLWSETLSISDTNLLKLAEEVSKADAQRNLDGQEWNAASARRTAADELRQEARGQLARRQNEKDVAAMSDRFLARRYHED